MKDEENPSIEDNNIKILRVNAGHFNGEVDKALAARATSFSLNPSADTSLKAFYAGLKQSGRQLSKEHLCAGCASPNHWAVEGSKSIESNGNSTTKKNGKTDRPGETAIPAHATNRIGTAASLADVVTSFATNSVEHLLFIDSHLTVVRSLEPLGH